MGCSEPKPVSSDTEAGLDIGLTDGGVDGFDDPGDGSFDGGDATIECVSDEDCDDQSGCTVDTCAEGICRYERLNTSVATAMVIETNEPPVSITLDGEVLHIARGRNGYATWYVAESPPTLLGEFEVREPPPPLIGDAGVEPPPEDPAGTGVETTTGTVDGVYRFEDYTLLRAGRYLHLVDSAGNGLARYRASDDVHDLIVIDDLVLNAVYAKGIEVVNFTNAVTPERSGRSDTLGRATSIALADDTLWIADGLLGLSYASVADPTKPDVGERRVQSPGRVEGVSAASDVVAFSEHGAGFGLAMMEDEIPRRIASVPLSAPVLDVAMPERTTVLAAVSDQGVAVFDVFNPTSPVELGMVDVGGTAISMSHDSARVAVATDHSVVLLDVTCSEAGGGGIEACASPAPDDPTCNGVDDDCDGVLDEDANACTRCTGDELGPPCNGCPAGVTVAPGWVCIPPGEFTMGSPEVEAGRDVDEAPQRRVTISRPFLMEETELTAEVWERVMSFAPTVAGDCGADCPVNSVSWYEAAAFANRRSILEGLRSCYQLTGCEAPLPGQGCEAGENECGGSLRCESVDRVFGCTGYRLPTEAEWEYAARAGSETRFWFGDDQAGLDAVAWYNSNAGQRPHAVGGKDANPWGLYDIYGNLVEWVFDWYGPYPERSERNPAGPSSGNAKAARGGSFSGRPKNNRSADRLKRAPHRRGIHFGMRLVREVSVPETMGEDMPTAE